jgi:hypothetical protein
VDVVVIVAVILVSLLNLVLLPVLLKLRLLVGFPGIALAALMVRLGSKFPGLPLKSLKGSQSYLCLIWLRPWVWERVYGYRA